MYSTAHCIWQDVEIAYLVNSKLTDTVYRKMIHLFSFLIRFGTFLNPIVCKYETGENLSGDGSLFTYKNFTWVGEKWATLSCITYLFQLVVHFDRQTATQQIDGWLQTPFWHFLTFSTKCKEKRWKNTPKISFFNCHALNYKLNILNSKQARLALLVAWWLGDQYNNVQNW